MIDALRSDFAETATLFTRDRVRFRAGFAPGPGGGTALLLVHGFNASLSKPPNRAVLATLTEQFPVVAVELRGHGRSQGLCTLGDKEILDVEAAARWAAVLGCSQVVTIGFSMGAAVVVRHAAIIGGVAGVVSVSGPAFWNYRGTSIMRVLHFGVENPLARQYLSRVMGTRVVPPPWPKPWPESPSEAAARIPPVPFLVVHGTQDGFFPDEHPRALIRAAARGARERVVPDSSELWLRDFGHAEAAIPAGLLREITEWVQVRCR